MKISGLLSTGSLAACLFLAACGGGAAPASSPVPSSAPPSAAPAKPSAAASEAAKPAASAAASAKPAASGAASAKPAASGAASAKPAASNGASAKPAASAKAPVPTATTLPAVAADESQAKVTSIPLPNSKSPNIDTMDINQSTHMLYVDDETSMSEAVFDISSPTAKFVKAIDLGVGSNGSVVAENVNKVFTGNRDSTWRVIDADPKSPTFNTVVAQFAAGGTGRIDLVGYDPKDKKVYGAANGEGFLSVVDATKNQMIKTIKMPSTILEQPYYSAVDGMMYVTGGRDNVIYQIDPAKDELVNKFDVVDKCITNGFAINAQGFGLIGCNNPADQHVAVWDVKQQKVSARFDNAGTGDLVNYSAKLDRFVFGARDFFRGPQIAIFGGSPVKFITNVPMPGRAGTAIIDETNKVVYAQDTKAGELGILSFPLPDKS